MTKDNMDEVEHRNFTKYKLDKYLVDSGRKYRELARQLVAQWKRVMDKEMNLGCLAKALAAFMYSDGDLLDHLEEHYFDVLDRNKLDEKILSFAKAVVATMEQENKNDVQQEEE